MISDFELITLLNEVKQVMALENCKSCFTHAAAHSVIFSHVVVKFSNVAPVLVLMVMSITCSSEMFFKGFSFFCQYIFQNSVLSFYTSFSFLTISKEKAGFCFGEGLCVVSQQY